LPVTDPLQRRAAVLGRPIGHSLSPLLHRAAYQALGLDWRYDAIDVSVQELADFVSGLGPEWVGLSLTMPLKEAALALTGDSSELARLTGAANTLLLRPEGLVADNTDGPGMVAALGEAGVRAPASAVVLGSGSTARSALAALAELGCGQAVLVSRSAPTAAVAVAARFGLPLQAVDWQPGPLGGAELVISAVPPGAADGFAPYVGDVGVLLDVVYDPWPTPLAAGCGGVVVPGTALLLHQAAAQVMLMTGRDAPLDAMRAALDGRSRLRAVPPKGD
jgi:shikimate dehydrogenase